MVADGTDEVGIDQARFTFFLVAATGQLTLPR